MLIGLGRSPAGVPSLKCVEKVGMWAVPDRGRRPRRPSALSVLVRAGPGGPAAANPGADDGVRPTTIYLANF
jgi:hypothetical protein